MYIYTESDMFHLLCAVDTTKLSGPGGISGYMLKGAAESIASSLTHLFNMPIKFGKVYTYCMESVLYCANSKKNNSTDKLAQYRLILLLSLVSKLLENHIYSFL